MNNTPHQHRSERAYHHPETQLTLTTTQGKYMAWAENVKKMYSEQAYIITNYVEAKKHPDKVSGYYRENYN